MKFLSSIKGILCIFVLFHHLWTLLESGGGGVLIPFIATHISENVSTYVNHFFCQLGRFSVFAFFLITGVGIRMAYEEKRCVSPQSIFMRYIKLMYPIFLVSLISYFLMKLKLFACNFPDQSFLSSWALAHNAFEPNIFEVLRISVIDLWMYNGSNPYVSFTWCMYCFLWGGYLCYALAVLIQNWKIHYRILFFIMLLAVFYNTDLVLFIVGFFIADIYCEKNVICNNKVGQVISLLLVFCIFIIANAYMDNYLLREVLAGIIMFIILCNSEFYASILSGKILKFLGKISWSLYLVQYSVIFSLACFSFQKISKVRSGATAELVTVVITTVTVIGLSIPFTQLTEWLNKKISACF